ncbi:MULTISPECIES: asparaginase [unclassified Leifsonia]|uniref:asparaginase n=1 Tax=unclassified Leifsonia TaxID=2663824 RepID=UPI000370F967|nr:MULTISPECIES: asparaginase [unclassified Leifsonia]TDQ03675.1 asparaginase [Leifsonia sp. 115AMFTsu3.1]
MSAEPHAGASPAVFSTAESVELAVVERSGFVESRHAGSAVVLGPEGDIVRTLGAPDKPVFPRSSMKPFQAVAVMGAGVPLEGASAVLATASHAGTPAHLSVVRKLLAQAQLTEDALRCPADWPLDTAARDELVRTGEHKHPLYMNCSGKHAAMLLACRVNGWPTESYLDPQHPIQQHIRDTVERFTGEKVVATGVDGCGAPVHAMSLLSLARGIQRIATASEGSPFALFRNAALLKNAVLADGWAIDGPGRANTVVIDELGVFAKGGAEGVMVMAAPDGTTVTLKVLDGSLRAASIVALRLLADAGALSHDDVDRVAPKLDLAVLGRGEPVGAIRPSYA